MGYNTTYAQTFAGQLHLSASGMWSGAHPLVPCVDCIALMMSHGVMCCINGVTWCYVLHQWCYKVSGVV